MYKLSYGLFVLTSAFEGKESGCIINTVGQVTDSPNRISITVNKDNFTEKLIKESWKFNISIISEAADFDLFRHFGFQSGSIVNKFDSFKDYKKSKNGLYYITKGTNGYISGTVEQVIDLESHNLYIASVDDMDILSNIPSATYEYYHSSIKPHQTQSKTNKVIWKCKICGYIYEGENLPENFICPLCKHPASDFEKVEA